MSVVWHRGVPWLDAAMTDAAEVGALDPVTEVARGYIAEAHGDPTRTPRPGATIAVTRGPWIAVVSAELVVVGHGTGEEGSSTASEVEIGGEAPAKKRKGGRGPKDYDELEAWLKDAGYPVVDSPGTNQGRRHRQVLDPETRGVLVVLSSGSEHRAFVNDVAQCRRTLGIELRRHR